MKKLIFRLKSYRTEKVTKVLCENLLYLYNYFAATHPGDLQKSDFIKEAVPFVPNWKGVSRDVFSYKKLGQIEVRQDDNLEGVAKKMSALMVKEYANRFPRAGENELKVVAEQEISDFFRTSKVK